MATLTVQQAQDFAASVGFSGQALASIVAIAQAESGLITDARNGPGDNLPPSVDRGVLQINSYWHAEVSDACCDDPACAFQAGYTISKQGTDFTAWSTYTSGEYEKYMATGTYDVVSPDFFSMKEFGAYNGDCGEAAMLMGLHSRNPQKWPLTLNALNALTADEIAKGYTASPNGSLNIYELANYARNVLKVPCTVVGWDASQNSGGATFSVDGLHTALHNQVLANPDGSQRWGRPVVIEVSAAGTGMIEDEHGVNYHFFVVGGARLPDVGWLRGDGDAVTYNDASGGSKPPILTSWSEITSAVPIAYLTIDLDTGANEMPLTLADLTGLYSADPANPAIWIGANGKQLFGAIQNYFANHNGRAQFGLVQVEEFALDPAYAGRICIGERSIIAYDPAHQWDHVPGETDPVCYTAHMDKFGDRIAAALIAQIQSSMQAKIDAIQAKLDAASAASAAAGAADASADAALQAKLDAANAEIAALKSAPPPAPVTPDALLKLYAALDALGVAHAPAS